MSWDSEDEEFKKTRKRRLKKLGIKVTRTKRNKSTGSEEWEIDKSGYKRKQGLFKRKAKRISYSTSKSKPKKRGTSNLKRLLRGEL
jgi:hypothetical protein